MTTRGTRFGSTFTCLSRLVAASRSRPSTLSRTGLLVAGALAIAAADSAAVAAVPAPIAAAVADAGRPAADKERDATRKPAETVAFAEVKPGDKVIELLPGRGYYTRILAKTVGPKGKVYVVVPSAMATRPGALDGLQAVTQANSNVYILLVQDLGSFEAPEMIDVVWTSENYHDLSNLPGGAAAVNRQVFENLRPDGIYFVEDHNAKADSPAEVTRTLHRIDVARARQELQNAGFWIEAEADHLRNPADPGDIPMSDPSVRGKTDKFGLKLRRP